MILDTKKQDEWTGPLHANGTPDRETCFVCHGFGDDEDTGATCTHCNGTGEEEIK